MKFGGHQSFHLRDSWIHKGLYWTKEEPQLLLSKERAMDELGVGKNMVEAIKYWLKASKLIRHDTKGFFFTEIAETFFEKDPYFELDGTLWVLQYLIATNKNEAATWYWFFNHFSAEQFDLESLSNSLYSYMQLKVPQKVKSSTLDKDLHCLLRMYGAVDYSGKKNPETENPSPFSKYKWIEKIKDNKYIRNKTSIYDFNLHIFCYLLYIFWLEHLNKPESMSLEEISDKYCSVGKVFLFSLDELAELIELSSKNTNYLDYSRTGGYFIIHLNNDKCEKALLNYFQETA